MGFESILGLPARNDAFFHREQLCDAFFKNIEKGSHILLSAPRRVGKTSLMFYLYDQAPENYIIDYEITESIDSENAFFKRLFRAFEKRLRQHEWLMSQVKTYCNSLGITAVGAKGVELEKYQINYFDGLLDLLENLDVKGQRIVFMIDEIADTLKNIIQKEGEQAGRSFLDKNRELRMNPNLFKKVQFVYAGSIGLENIVAGLKCSEKINDLYPFQVPPLSPTETEAFLAELSAVFHLRFGAEEKEYLKERTAWHIPYYYQLIFDRINKLLFDSRQKDEYTDVSKTLIDAAFESALTERNYFKHWESRLKTTFDRKEYKYMIEVLCIAAADGHVSMGGKKGLMNIASKKKYLLAPRVHDLLHVLTYDGYLNNDKSPQQYQFNSPLLRDWWKQNVITK